LTKSQSSYDRKIAKYSKDMRHEKSKLRETTKSLSSCEEVTCMRIRLLKPYSKEVEYEDFNPIKWRSIVI